MQCASIGEPSSRAMGVLRMKGRQGMRSVENEVILLSVAAAMFAWVMQSALDFYFQYWGRTFPQVLLLNIPEREIYSRVVITTGFLLAGVIISKMVRRLGEMESKRANLNACLKAIRAVNQTITRVRDRGAVIEKVCRQLVEHREYAEVEICLTESCGGASGLARGEGEAEGATWVDVPLSCAEHVYGNLTALLPARLASDSQERELLQEVAEDLAFSIRSIIIEEERFHREETQRALYQVAAALTEAAVQGELQPAVQYGLSGVLGTSDIKISEYDGNAETITRPCSTGETRTREVCTTSAAGTLEGCVAASGVTLRVRRSQMERMTEEGLLSGSGRLPAVWAGVPYRVGGQVGGVVSVAHPDDGGALGEQEMEVIEFVAHQLGKTLEQQRTDAAVREQREQLQTILDSVPARIFYRDCEGRYLRVNRVLAESLGIPKEEWVGRTFEEVLPGQGDGNWTADETVIRTGEPNLGRLEVFESGGKMRWMVTDRIPYRNNDGEIAGVIGLSIDITDRREAEAALAVKEEELRQSQKMEAVGLLAGGIAHDFNNLLTAISGYAELSFAEIDPDDPLGENLSGIRDAAGRAACLTRQLLAFSRRQPLQLSVVNVNDIVTDVRRMLERLIGEDIELSTCLAQGVPYTDADPSQIAQAVVNLAVNARDAMPEGGTLTIETDKVCLSERDCLSVPHWRPGTFVRISVRDNGTGMDEDMLKHIFEPFFTTKGPHGGTGLGLAVIYGSVKQHGGWIDVESMPFEGSTFRICLPATDELPGDDHKEEERTDTIDPFGRRILVVEDEDLIRTLAVKVLRKQGYSIVEAASAEEAIEHLDGAAAPFDLIFTDVVLPGMSGVQLADTVLSRDPDSRVLLCSGYADRRSQWSLISERGFPFLDKPYSVADLLKVVRGIVQ